MVPWFLILPALNHVGTVFQKASRPTIHPLSHALGNSVTPKCSRTHPVGSEGSTSSVGTPSSPYTRVLSPPRAPSPVRGLVLFHQAG